MLRAGSASQSWHRPRLSMLGLLPARDVGSVRGLPSTPCRPQRGKPYAEMGNILSCIPHEHKRSWFRGWEGAAGCHLCLLPARLSLCS